MSNEKLDKLIGRVAEVSQILGRVSEDLRQIVVDLKAENGIPAKPATKATPVVTPSKRLEDIRVAFPEHLEELLNFSEKGGNAVIKPKQFLGSENFAKIASCVRGLGGEYISAGKDSHFRVKL